MKKNFLFEEICKDLYAGALEQEKQWAKQIRAVEPQLQGSDQDVIHSFFINIVKNQPLKKIKTNSMGKEIIKPNLYDYYLNSISYDVETDGKWGTDTKVIDNQRLGAVRSLLNERSKILGKSKSDIIKTDKVFFDELAGWAWEDLTEKYLRLAVENLQKIVYFTNKKGENCAAVISPKYSIDAKPIIQRDLVVNFDLDLKENPIPLNIDVKRNLNKMHIGSKTYDPIEVRKHITTDDFVLAEFLKTQIIKNKMEKYFPVFLSINGGMQTKLSSEILQKPDEFYLQDSNDSLSKEEIYKMAEDIYAELPNKEKVSKKEVKKIINNSQKNLRIMGHLWYGKTGGK